MVALDTMIGPYRLVRKLGEGGMGEVYEALHQTIERQVAIKILHPIYAHSSDIGKRFVNEARAVNLINHPGLVQISDFGQLADGSRYIVMEYLRGETLGQRLKRTGGSLPLPHVLYTAWQVASALVAAHEKGITHRDLKPDNIMLVPEELSATGERAKLLDFGIAKLDLDVAGGSSTLDQTMGNSLSPGRLLGTPAYMSPEQCRGGEVVGAKSDVYSLGVVLYEVLAGEAPFTARRVPKLLSMHLTEEPRPLQERAPQAPGALVALVHRMLRKEPHERPVMLEVATELEALYAEQELAHAQLAAAGGVRARVSRPRISASDLPLARRPPGPSARTEGPEGGASTTAPVEPVSPYDRTLASGPDNEPPEPPGSQHALQTQLLEPQPAHPPHVLRPEEAPPSSARATGTAPLPPPRIAPTLLSQRDAAPSHAEREPQPARPPGRFSLVLATVLGGAMVAAGGLLGPVLTRQHAAAPAAAQGPARPAALPPPTNPSPTTAPAAAAAAPAPSSAAPGSQTPPAAAVSAGSGSRQTGPAGRAQNPSVAAPQPGGRAPRTAKRPAGSSSPLAGTNRAGARPAASARPAESEPPDAPRKSQFKIID